MKWKDGDDRIQSVSRKEKGPDDFTRNSIKGTNIRKEEVIQMLYPKSLIKPFIWIETVLKVNEEQWIIYTKFNQLV